MTRGSHPIRQTQWLEIPSKVWILIQMERIQSLQFWFILGPSLLPENQKYCLKPKISGKPTSLAISNSISPRSHKNPIILVKLIKNKLFGPKLGINCSVRPHQRVIRSFHVGYNKTIHLYFLDTKFQLLRSCCSWLYIEERTMFFFFKTQLDPFFYFFFILFYLCFGAVGGFETTPVKNVRLSWNFVHR